MENHNFFSPCRNWKRKRHDRKTFFLFLLVEGGREMRRVKKRFFVQAVIDGGGSLNCVVKHQRRSFVGFVTLQFGFRVMKCFWNFSIFNSEMFWIYGSNKNSIEKDFGDLEILIFINKFDAKCSKNSNRTKFSSQRAKNLNWKVSNILSISFVIKSRGTYSKLSSHLSWGKKSSQIRSFTAQNCSFFLFKLNQDSNWLQVFIFSKLSSFLEKSQIGQSKLPKLSVSYRP